MTTMDWAAHSSPDGNEPLAHHLTCVGTLAGEFAAAFDATAWGQTAGLLHDVGKACDAFQRRLSGAPESVDHIAAGIQVAAKASPLGRLVAYAVAGHHGGMPDAGELEARRQRTVPYDETAIPALPPLGAPPVRMTEQGAALFVRMIFSCLADADFLATEAFYRPQAPSIRGTPFDAEALLARLSAYMDGIMAEARPSELNRLRRQILSDCLRKADAESGVFTLSVPTGGGKTLAAMAFALAHAKRWGKRRVITVIPYTSIIEQNAAIYRAALGAENVLEHHSAFRHRDDHDDVEADARLKLRLAEENWDAPVVVTTSVQFFESLFSNRPSRCRKLHNIAGSVMLLDEAQLLPPHFLAPCLHVLQALVRDYGCTVVLSTATQPALTDKRWLPCALEGVTEIVGDPAALHRNLRRVGYHWAGTLSDDRVAGQLAEAPQGLVVVNTRRHARELFQLVGAEPGAVHLSATMTPAHRSKVLERIRDDLRDGRPCRIVSTQVVECGVDIDLPMVMRALAGLDSVIQVAGRCNRSGGRNHAVVTVFEPERGTPTYWREHANLARRVLTEISPDDPASPEAVEWYFQRLYQTFGKQLDKHGIGGLQAFSPKMHFNFRTVAEKFNLIAGGQVDVAVPNTEEAAALIRRVDHEGASPALLRALQRHTVQIRPDEAKKLAGALRLADERVWVLDPAAYDPELGVVI